jgi:hypothetical protein
LAKTVCRLAAIVESPPTGIAGKFQILDFELTALVSPPRHRPRKQNSFETGGNNKRLLLAPDVRPLFRHRAAHQRDQADEQHGEYGEQREDVEVGERQCLPSA